MKKISLYSILTLIIFLSGFEYCLSQSSKCIPFNDSLNFETLTEFEDRIAQSKLILIGEAPHRMPANYLLQSKFAIYLNKKIGIKYILIEHGQSEAYMLNKYLKFGNAELLDKTYLKLLGLKEGLDAINDIYEYNNGSNKIGYYGVDFEREPALTSSILFFLEDFRDNSLVKPFIEKIQIRYDTIGKDLDPKNFIYFLRQEMSKYESLFAKSEDWDTIKEIIFNDNFYTNFYERDKYMVKKINKLYIDYGCLFGSFGTMHTQKDVKNVLAGLLINKFGKDNVLTINMHHFDSKYLDGSEITSSFLNDYGMFKRKEIKLFEEYFYSLRECNVFICEIPKSKSYLKLNLKCDYLICLFNQQGTHL
jgi:hypothetical protein